MLKDFSEINGWLFVDKPIGVTSFFVVKTIKKQLKVHKIGHGGTLDPLASGVLPIALNEATKTVDHVLNADKVYEFTIQFGCSTDTLDSEGKIILTNDFMPAEKDINDVLKNFLGEINQTPPKFSAIKINGQRAYDLARKGIEFEIKKRKVKIFSLNMVHFEIELMRASFVAKVSKGTYIRALAYDIATELGALGYIFYLRRKAISVSKEVALIGDIYNISNYINTSLLKIEDLLDDIPAYLVDNYQVKELLNGNLSSLDTNIVFNDGVFKALYNGMLVALLRYKDGKFSFLRVFNQNLGVK